MAIKEICKSAIAEIKGYTFAWSSIPQSKEIVFYKGKLTMAVMQTVSRIMAENGVSFKFGNYISLNEAFDGFVSRNGHLFVDAHKSGNGKPFYTWGFIESH